MPDPTLQLRYYQETGQTDLAKKYEQYLRETGQMPPAASVPEEPKADVLTKVLGTAASLLRDTGLEALQVGASALVNGIPYRDARAQIRAAEDATPKKLTIPARIAGGGIAGAAIPGGPALQGARFGILSGLAQSDPDVGVKTRLHDAALGGTVGAATGGIAQNATRIPWGKVAGAIVSPRKTAIRAVGGVLRDALAEAKAPAATAKAAADAVPMAEGFVGNGTGNLADAAVNNGPMRLASRPASSPVVGSITPTVEGLNTHAIADVLDAMKARQASDAEGVLAAIPDRQSLYDAFSNEARAVDDALGKRAPQLGPRLPDVVKATERYRTESGRLQPGPTQARIDYWVERMAKGKQP